MERANDQDVMALREQVAALVERVKALEDHVEITQLTARYGPAVDSGSATAAAALWTPDGVFDVVGHGPFTGRDEIAAMVDGAGHQGLIMNGCGHVLTVPVVEIKGDEATGRSYAFNVRWDEEAQRFWVARLSANTWRWRRTPDEGWRIVEREGSVGSRLTETEACSMTHAADLASSIQSLRLLVALRPIARIRWRWNRWQTRDSMGRNSHRGQRVPE